MPSDQVMPGLGETPDAVLRYAAHDDGLVDVHLPAAAVDGPRPRPLVVHVHGGFWRTRYDRLHARPFAEGLVAQGYVVAVPEYRRGPGAWPSTRDDLATVLDRLPDLLHGIGITTTTTTVTGHSAGGHLALWLANEPCALDRVVALAPVGDLRQAAEWHTGAGAVVDFLGGTPQQRPQVYDAADPATRMRERPPVPVVVVHGDRDDDVPVELSRGLSGRFDWLDYRELPGAGHHDVIDPGSPVWSAVLAAIGG